MNFLRSKVGLVSVVLVIVLALFLVRPGAQRLRSRIMVSTTMALGRQVDIGSVRLRLLPRPGFDLENFVVHDDPRFGAEPMLRAQEVSATIRIIPLLRGRLEISRLDLTEPSVNLVRDSDGHWNLENLLERAARDPIAPTGASKTEARPMFPYIEADRSRINFKFGQEKKPYALTDADFSFWQDSENRWGMRLKAEPVRTDLNLGDTGTLRVSGSWERAESLRQTPVDFTLQWDNAQLGQVSQLIEGADKGWRGSLRLSAALSGSPADLSVQTHTVIDDFRRFDILGGGTLQLRAQCTGHYSSAEHVLSKIACSAPIGNGVIKLGGDASGLANLPAYHLQLAAQDVPMSAVAALARHGKRDIPDDLVADGTVSGDFSVTRDERHTAALWEGSGEARDLRVKSDSNKMQVAVDKIPFAVKPADLRRSQRPGERAGRDPALSSEMRLEIGPFNLTLGRPAPAAMQGWISRSGYDFSLQGDSDVQRVLQMARTVGLPASQPAAHGLAKLSLRIDGTWAGFAPASVTGTALVKAVRAEVPGLNSPLDIASASLVFSPDGVSVRNVAASLGDSTWSGSLDMPRHCSLSTNCLIQFDLHADQIGTDELNQLLNPNSRKRPWYRWLTRGGQSGVPGLGSLHATGKLTANRFTLRGLVASKASATIDLQAGKLRVTELRAEVLGGKHLGEWQADFTTKPPRYTGSGTVENAALRQLSQLMNDGWITGAAGGTYRIAVSGYTVGEMVSSAEASLKFEARDGSLPHVTLTGAETPLLIHRFAGRLALREGKFEIAEGKLEVPGGIYQVSGTASLGRKLDVRLLRDTTHGFSVTGTLTEPRVVPQTSAETRAALKP